MWYHIWVKLTSCFKLNWILLLFCCFHSSIRPNMQIIFRITINKNQSLPVQHEQSHRALPYMSFYFRISRSFFFKFSENLIPKFLEVLFQFLEILAPNWNHVKTIPILKNVYYMDIWVVKIKCKTYYKKKIFFLNNENLFYNDFINENLEKVKLLPIPLRGTRNIFHNWNGLTLCR